MAEALDIAIIGGGPAGLMAAEKLSAAGRAVTVFERMPSLGRKLLMAGRGGLNLTHSEPLARFITRYGDAATRLKPVLDAYPPQAVMAWAEALGQPVFVGSSGRIFPKVMKASPLLRAWLGRLSRQGVQFRLRHDWLGWSTDGALQFRHRNVVVEYAPRATILALGGASWPKLGTDGSWSDLLAGKGVSIAPLVAANCGVTLAWSEVFRARFHGAPLKRLRVSFKDRSVMGEAVVTAGGLEGGAIYALAPALREALARDGAASLTLDLRPDLSAERIAEKLRAVPAGQSRANQMRKALGLPPVAIGLLREAGDLPREPDRLAGRIKALTLEVTGLADLARAISTAGGVSWDALDDNLMLRALPNVYVAGEMIDWEAPTGGYLLQACLATGAAVANAILKTA
jgi:uncharacterized flavoprotein (TIGR03862 family)